MLNLGNYFLLDSLWLQQEQGNWTFVKQKLLNNEQTNLLVQNHKNNTKNYVGEK